MEKFGKWCGDLRGLWGVGGARGTHSGFGGWGVRSGDYWTFDTGMGHI